ncbi:MULTISPECIES: flagellar basal-body MS-ring/collar protein FliF [unclassified Serratia (in: enterobacteria)]|uniref:flagellar basal-body MS-ring/collar protein FliF n=1 Tax=unclassified Serratia (in: enterobacteria) TaxID=2647522 RepID=UPI0005020243|nr:MULTISPECIES: flagellar basal-body MS-ring/collar protein FliF [unclassified Serratia (in: enterobacteria)]KFK95360.1 flagellar MS-ring protein [Serratia sp. Ag2]KFK98708.1 flagellar MS-ring protein [Serratia sp. Ag1]
MLDKIKTQFAALLSTGGNNRNKWLIGGAVLVLTGAIVTSLWRSEPGYVALYGANEKLPTAQVVEALGTENISYRVNPDSGQILVPESKLARARMALAAKGISAVLPEGYELMDKEELLGSSQFVQNVRYKRSLEGELSKSIMGLDPVDSARVHLGLSEASSFVMSNKPESSASVIVQLRAGKQLDDPQVAAIVQLVSGSVPGMKSSNVRVVDQNGNLLSENIQNNNLMGIRQGNDVTQRLKADTEKNVSVLLTSLVGANHFRISAAPQVNMSSVEETQERLGKEGRITDENISQENMTNEMAIGIPGSLSNRPATPPAQAGQAGNTAQTTDPRSLSNRNQEQRKYAYDREIRHTRYPGFQLEKMRVAVALDQTAPALADITPEKIASLTRLVEEAAGIDKERGDSLTLDLMAFTRPAPVEVPVLNWWQDPAIQYWGQMGGIGLLALLTLLFGVRPLMLRVTQRQSSEVAELPEPSIDTALLETDTAKREGTLTPGLPSASFQNEDNLPPQSSGLETKVEYLQMLAQSETERVAEVLKQWINSNERSNSTQQ